MKVPIALNEVGVIYKSQFNDSYFFYRNGSYRFDRDYKNKRLMTWREFKSLYPYEIGAFFHRSKTKL